MNETRAGIEASAREKNPGIDNREVNVLLT